MVRNQRLATAGRNYWRDTGEGGVTRSQKPGHLFGRSWRHRAQEATDGDATGDREKTELASSSSPSVFYCYPTDRGVALSGSA